MDELERQKRLADVSEQLRKEEEELIFSRSEEGKQVRAIEEKIQKTKDLRREEEELGKTQEKLREELKESLLAPFKSMLEMIPKPLRILGKMGANKLKALFGQQDTSKDTEQAIEQRADAAGNLDIDLNPFSGISKAFGGISKAFKTIKDFVKKFLSWKVAIVALIGLIVGALAIKYWEPIKEKVLEFKDKVVQLATDIKEFFVGIFDWFGETGTGEDGQWTLKTFISNVWQNVKDWFSSAFNWTVDIAKEGLGAGKEILQEKWEKLKNLVASLPAAIGDFIWSPGSAEILNGELLEVRPKLFGIELPKIPDLRFKLIQNWENFKNFVAGLPALIADFVWSPGSAEIVNGELLEVRPQLFGIELPKIPDLRYTLSRSWDNLLGWINGVVTSIGKFFWDGEKGEIFGMKLPEFSFPSISLDSFVNKLKAFIRPLVEKIPSLLLPDSLAEWVGIDPKAKEKEAKLASLEAEKQGIMSELDSTEVSPEDAMSSRQEDLYKRLEEIKKEKQALKQEKDEWDAADAQVTKALVTLSQDGTEAAVKTERDAKRSKGYIQPTMRELGPLSNRMLEEERNPEGYIKSLFFTSAAPAGALNQASFAGAGAGGNGVSVANANINAGTNVTNNTTINTKPKDVDPYTSKQKRTERANW